MGADVTSSPPSAPPAVQPGSCPNSCEGRQDSGVWAGQLLAADLPSKGQPWVQLTRFLGHRPELQLKVCKLQCLSQALGGEITVVFSQALSLQEATVPSIQPPSSALCTSVAHQSAPTPNLMGTIPDYN